MLPPPDEWCRTPDHAVWRPYVLSVLREHGLDDGVTLEPGYNPTNPTYVAGEAVVKVYCGPRAADRHAAECAALAAVAADPAIPAPRLLGSGAVEGRWPYLVMSRLDGVPVEGLTETLAREVGALVARLHALPYGTLAREADWPPVPIAAAAERSSLPPHLAAQAEAYVARHGTPTGDPVPAHGDVCAMHVLVEDGRVSGLLDWGDTMVTDRHYELVQPFRDLCGCDATLFRAFLDGYGWRVEDGFPDRALAWALRRQAVGMTQHRTIDVFMDPADVFPMEEMATLEEVAEAMFG
jgi:Ser/Thr protein kinase RdoA (MazF antagonist)